MRGTSGGSVRGCYSLEETEWNFIRCNSDIMHYYYTQSFWENGFWFTYLGRVLDLILIEHGLVCQDLNPLMDH